MSNKIYIVSLNAMLIIMAAFIIFSWFLIANLSTEQASFRVKQGIIEEKIGFLEDSDIQMQDLKHELFKDLLKGDN